METLISLKKSTNEGIVNFCIELSYKGIIITQKRKKIIDWKKNHNTERIIPELSFNCIMLNQKKELIDHLYPSDTDPDQSLLYGLPPGKNYSKNNAFSYLFQRFEDENITTELNNKAILICLNRLPQLVRYIYFFINCQHNLGFLSLSELKIGLYKFSVDFFREKIVEKEINTFSLQEPKSLLVAQLYRSENEWFFSLSQKSYPDAFVGQTIFSLLQTETD
jgi:stress response protein SCP2